jgi:hypothetical protein
VLAPRPLPALTPDHRREGHSQTAEGEYPAIYHKDRVVGHIRTQRPGESKEETQQRADREFMALQQSPLFRVWACAGVDEMITALHERLAVGSLA